MRNSNGASSLPILLSYLLDEAGKLLHHQTLTLAGNVLDVAIGPSQWGIIVSIDSVHAPGSLKTFAPQDTPKPPMFESFTFPYITAATSQVGGHVKLQWERTSFARQLNEAASKIERVDVPIEASTQPTSVYSSFGEMLYGLENLRKKRWQEVENADDEEPLEEAMAEVETSVQPR